MDPRSGKAFDFAQETTKQLLTLATGVIALTIAFTKDFATGASTAARVVMACAWLVLLTSAVFGLLTLMALTGSLGVRAEGEPSIQESNVTRPARIQAGAFLLGLLLIIIAGIMAL
jgi:hypothetical protein